MTEAPLLIYHHIPKTGGTSLRAVVEENYGEGEFADLYRRFREARGEAAAVDRPFDAVAWYREWYGRLAEEERERIACVASHTANCLAPSLERPWRAFCMLRDPVERVWSLYRFLRGLGDRSAAAASGRQAVALGRTIVRKGWSLADVYRELGGGGPRASRLHEQFHPFFNGQARSILEPWRDPARLEYWAGLHEAAAALRDEALEILASRYVVGVQDRFDLSLQRFVAAFGWEPASAPHLNRGRSGGRPDAQTRALVLAHNQIDAELHARFSRAVESGPAPRPPEARLGQAVCVLGMSRSGTSVAARVLALLGVDLGAEGELMEAAPGNNPAGFWEHEGIADLNEDILATLGDAPRQRWRWPPALEPGWEEDPRLHGHLAAARSILRRSFAGRRLWGWKDPRTCLTLPFWQRLVPDLRYVVCVRHPLDVAASLAARDGMPEEESLRLWQRYMTDAVRHSDGAPRAFVSYEGWFSSWEEQAARLAGLIGRPGPSERQLGAIAAHLDEGLWHHRRGDAGDDERDAGLPPEVAALYAELRARCAADAGAQALPGGGPRD